MPYIIPAVTPHGAVLVRVMRPGLRGHSILLVDAWTGGLGSRGPNCGAASGGWGAFDDFEVDAEGRCVLGEVLRQPTSTQTMRRPGVLVMMLRLRGLRVLPASMP
ncbi:hypothetical protein [Streptomyces canus]|uniref:hypothetical protein n=1 Tax=Streptomyces canus TaxID=58343 RepID=UPI00371C3034